MSSNQPQQRAMPGAIEGGEGTLTTDARVSTQSKEVWSDWCHNSSGMRWIGLSHYKGDDVQFVVFLYAQMAQVSQTYMQFRERTPCVCSCRCNISLSKLIAGFEDEWFGGLLAQDGHSALFLLLCRNKTTAYIFDV